MRKILLYGFCLVFSSYLSAQNENVLFYPSSSINETLEETTNNGCNEFNTFIVSVRASFVTAEQIAAFTFDLSTATLGEDFDISPSSLTFGVSDTEVTQEVTLTIYNDAIIEGIETIQMNFENNSQTRERKITIKDNDYLPRLGSGTVELLNQKFTTSEPPEGWTASSPDINSWAFNGINSASERAFVVPAALSTAEPTYEGSRYEQGTILLFSKEIDASGVTNVTVSFDWEAGGEREGGALLDYGEFLYTLDGNIYTSLEKFGTETEPFGPNGVGTFNMPIPALDHSKFVLIWKWHNDELLAGSYSFSFGNVVVTGNDTIVESDLAHADSENVKAADQVYFISDQDAGLIGFVENASADLGCVTLLLEEVGVAKSFTNIAGNHSGKVLKITADGADAATATYDITLYFTNTELNDFTNPNNAAIIKVNSDNINDAINDAAPNYLIAGALSLENTEKEYRSFKGTFTGGNGIFALISQETLATTSSNVSQFNVFPTLINNSESVNITNSETFIEKVDIYSINGKLVKSFDFNSKYNVEITMSKLSSGMYFLNINKDRSNTHKFIVK
ncbi:hypothetical protein BTO04_01090 [Polaribacter sp. SA4-10]|uniref:T9SS type A sorting domain-containing protein n=1 Tax=Polaribacter sp. SA4-10 TaxID=754397 RepID=UPI000B55E29B|nr:T9SS type A sorting domain-containing protein [Polaribacter sp. SA4-10]ARV05370.1 hypothetical protein BTO04_01090 [Polaribacter sp. SA4-10]